jgi:lipoprotein-releasing system ATP-binding protein
MENIVELNNVDKVYPGAVETKALSDINLKIEESSFCSLVGESGSGKSTLMNIIGTLDTATRGHVLINGTQTDSLNRNGLAKLRNETIGFVFQFHYLLPEFTAIENVLMPYIIKNGKAGKEIVQRADELFEFVGISKVKNNLAPNMSGGQQQRTAIVRALINNPKIILADEPTGNLDSETTATVYKIFRELNERFKTTFIIVTHDRKIAEQTDRIVEIKDGKISMDIRK